MGLPGGKSQEGILLNSVEKQPSFVRSSDPGETSLGVPSQGLPTPHPPRPGSRAKQWSGSSSSIMHTCIRCPSAAEAASMAYTQPLMVFSLISGLLSSMTMTTATESALPISNEMAGRFLKMLFSYVLNHENQDGRMAAVRMLALESQPHQS